MSSAADIAPGPALVTIDGLRVVVSATGETILPSVSCAIPAGQIVGLAGETGSGKSTLGLSLLGFTPPGLRVADGSIEVLGHPMLTLPAAQLRELRGGAVSYVPQDPAAALNPALRVGDFMAEVLAAHGVSDREVRQERIAELFAAVGLPDTAGFARRYPHELSGGQQQRVAIAIAFALEPRLVVMDEPTTGLDVSTTLAVVDLVRRLSHDAGASVVFVSHDLRLLMTFADRILVLLQGEVVDDVAAGRFADEITHPYSRRLLASLPRTDRRSPRVAGPERPAIGLELAAVSARYGSTVVTHDVNLRVAVGECVALVGESGSGKTTLARCVAGFHDDYDGDVALMDKAVPRSLTRRSAAERATVQYVFQNPDASLNPRRGVGESVALAARQTRGLSRRESRAEALRLLERVGLRRDHLGALPHELSGGQRQRIALARALAADPDVLVCDEVTSSLDVSVQAEIVRLLQELQWERGLTMLFITHDLALAQVIAARTVVLLHGEVVEQGDSRTVLHDPQHDYTRTLVEAARATHVGE